MTQAPTAAPTIRKRPNILIVDDVPEIGQLLAATLHEEFSRILTATNGKQALELLQANQICLVITDIYMPGMDGFELAEIIWQSQPDLPILFISGFSHKSFSQLQLRKYDFLYKPFSRVVVLEKIDRLLGGPMCL